eukprot:UN31794
MNITSGDTNEDRIVKAFNWYLPLFYLLIQVGFLPPLFIYIFTNQWTAPPFIYPKEGYDVIMFHIVPGFSWIILSSIQVKLITFDDHTYHRVLGGVFVILLFGGFIYTAFWSMKRKLSPLGTHVELMEKGLLLGIVFYFMGGIFYIILASRGPYEDNHQYFINHKIFMTACIIGAAGPGVFRVLRTIRETVTGRIWYVGKYVEYQSIKNRGGKDLDNLQDVESTYFNLAFLVNNLLMYVFYVLAGIQNEQWAI